MVSLFLKKVCDDPDCEWYGMVVGIVTIYMTLSHLCLHSIQSECC